QTLPALKQDFLEGSIIARLGEQRGPAQRAIQNVVDISGIRATSPTSHARKLLEGVGVRCQRNKPDPFYFLCGARVVAQQVPRNGAVPELVEAGGVAGQAGFEVVANLTVQSRTLADQIAAMADEQLQGRPGLVARGFQQRATRDGSPMDGREVLVVGLVARIDRLAVLLGDEGMKDTGLEARRRERALHEAVITARAFDGDHAIVEVVLLERLTDLCDGGIESRSGMSDAGRRDEQAAVEVGEEQLGANFATVKADDAEVLRTDLLDARMEHATRLAHRGRSSTPGRTPAGTSSGHETSLRKNG